MKISKVILMAAVLVIAVAVFSCKSDSDGGLGLLGTKSVKDLKQPFPAGIVTATSKDQNGKNQIVDLLDQGLTGGDFGNALLDASFTARTAQLTAANIVFNSADLKYVYDVKIDDSLIFKGKTGTAAATMKGNSSVNWTASKPTLLALWNDNNSYGFPPLPSTMVAGDTFTAKGKGKTAFAITDGWFITPTTTNNAGVSGKYYITGFVNGEGNINFKYAVKDAAKGYYESTYNYTDKKSATVAIYFIKSDSTGYGAKFTLAASWEGADKNRAANGSSGDVSSDIVVYSADNKEVDRIKGDDAKNYLGYLPY